MTHDHVERFRIGQEPALDMRIRTCRNQPASKLCPRGVLDLHPLLSERGAVAVDGGDDEIGRSIEQVRPDNFLIQTKLLRHSRVTSTSRANPDVRIDLLVFGDSPYECTDKRRMSLILDEEVECRPPTHQRIHAT